MLQYFSFTFRFNLTPVECVAYFSNPEFNTVERMNGNEEVNDVATIVKLDQADWRQESWKGIEWEMHIKRIIPKLKAAGPVIQ